jgi:hypothetical protein
MVEITLPKRFEKKLKDNQRVHGAAKIAVSKFSEWLYPNQLVFFPEYTDHGIQHIQDVLNTADQIIKEEAFEILTSEDIYVLTLAILLHDCAMHMSKQGLLDLIKNQIYSSGLFGYPLEDSFQLQWEKFEREVAKYSSSDWQKFFADGSIVNFPSLENDLTEKQHVIVGEFIRKYHARIAQVIGLHGLPTGKDPVIFFDKELLHLNELAGFAARSHNISLREAVEVIGQDHARTTKNTHLAFIMGVLRIADYLQFENKRTPKLCFNVKAFCSPISIGEWKKQMAVINTHNAHNDEELLYVDAVPEDAPTLEGIGKLLKGLQLELDALWAVLGEVYSRIPSKRNLGINIRRVRSSIDNPASYVSKHFKKFHPKLIGLTTNDERLYPLLASPLYGDRPLIGLRELLQNSIDACNERFAQETGNDPIFEAVPHGIQLLLDKENKTLTISDEGNGMDVNIIENYFLKIGSSFRYSSTWQDKYLKAEGAIVPRTGRFGIGVLAGFLLGEKISVHTRKSNEPEDKGIFFSMTPSSQKIQLNYQRKDSAGTTIIVELNEATFEKLKKLEKKETPFDIYRRSMKSNREENEWRWYYLDSPTIQTNFHDKEINTLPKKHTILKNNFAHSWKKIDTTGSVKCYWRSKQASPMVYCNGILIPNIDTPKFELQGTISKSHSSTYEVFYIDNDAVLPLNLQRNSFLSKDFYLEDEIHRDLLTTHIKSAVKELKTHTSNSEIDKYKITSSPTFRNEHSQFAICDGKATPIYPGFIFDATKQYLVDYTKKSIGRGLVFAKSKRVHELNYGHISLGDIDKQPSEVRSALMYFTGKSLNSYAQPETEGDSDKKTKLNGWFFIKKFDFEKLDNSDAPLLESFGYETRDLPDSWVVICKPELSNKIPPDILKLMEEKIDFNCYMFSIVSIKDNEKQTSLFHKIWESLNLPNSLDATVLRSLQII